MFEFFCSSITLEAEQWVKVSVTLDLQKANDWAVWLVLGIDPHFIHQDSKILAPVVFFAELGFKLFLGLFRQIKEHRPLDFCLHSRKESNVPKLKRISKVLLSHLYNVVLGVDFSSFSLACTDIINHICYFFEAHGLCYYQSSMFANEALIKQNDAAHVTYGVFI